MRPTATYSPEDNKLRLYPIARLDDETFARVRACGFRWAPRQSLFVAPMWTPDRVDLLESLCGEIGDEDTTLVDRAEERAERFDGYHERRTEDAESAQAVAAEVAQRFEFGQPILVGHHSERKARKDAERIQSNIRRAIRAWETVEYWQRRAAGAVRHAKYKELPAVRARRIKGIEADLRKRQRQLQDAEQFGKLWSRPELSLKQALTISNVDHLSMRVAGQECPASVWSLLKNGTITAAAAADAAVKAHARQAAWDRRWIQHYDFRLAYERAMLTEAGGTVVDRKALERGGGVRCWASPRGGWSWVKKVNRVSVTVEDNWGRGGRNFTRTIPFDKLAGVMTCADVDAARSEGRLTETEDGSGYFVVAPTPPQNLATTISDQVAPATSPATQVASLKAGLASVQMRAVHAPQLFPTPSALAARMVELASIAPGQTVLEPSAGTGALLQALAAAAPQSRVTAIEINHDLVAHLQRQQYQARQGDFLQYSANELGQFDRIVMNPPFGRAADIRHIRHAIGFLRPGGRLVALCANGPRQAKQLQPLADSWEELPDGTFQDQGTHVRVALLTLSRDG